MQRALLITHGFPPVNNSGMARSYYFAKHLPEFGYQPLVLTHCSRDEVCDAADLLSGLNDRVIVTRVNGWNSGVRSFIGKRFHNASASTAASEATRPGSNATKAPAESSNAIAGTKPYHEPDRSPRLWRAIGDSLPWVWPAVTAGVRLCHKFHPAVVWATGDPWNSLVIGYMLSRLTGLPLISDIRDPWTYGPRWDRWPAEKRAWCRRWERRVLHRSSRVVYTSPLTTRIMQARAGKTLGHRMVTITNGFAATEVAAKRDIPESKCLFQHVGTLHPVYRRPDPFLQGLSIACRDSSLANDVRVQFVGRTGQIQQTIDAHGVSDQVEACGTVSPSLSVQMMRGADVLIAIQTCSGPGMDVIAGKLYEYLASQKPVLGVVPESGGDAWLIHRTQAGIITGATDPELIATAIRQMWQRWKDKTLSNTISAETLAEFDRRTLTGRLALLFDEVRAERDSSE